MATRRIIPDARIFYPAQPSRASQPHLAPNLEPVRIGDNGRPSGHQCHEDDQSRRNPTRPPPSSNDRKKITMSMPTVERTIHFFVADAGKATSGEPAGFDSRSALAAIDVLPFDDIPRGRYQRDGDGNVLCLFTSAHHRGAVEFCRIRRTGLPLLESGGHLSELPIAPDAGLSEGIHVLFFAENIVGAVYNHYAPRLPALGPYLYERTRGAIPPVTFRPLLDSDASRQFDTLGDLRILEFDIRPSFAAIINEASPSLGDAFGAISKLFDSPEIISLVVKAPRHGAFDLLSRLAAPMRNILRRHDVRENVERLRLRGKNIETGRVETMDLLRDRFVSTQEIVRMSRRSRSLDPGSAFDAIERAYWSLKDELEMAASVSP